MQIDFATLYILGIFPTFLAHIAAKYFMSSDLRYRWVLQHDGTYLKGYVKSRADIHELVEENNIATLWLVAVVWPATVLMYLMAGLIAIINRFQDVVIFTVFASLIILLSNSLWGL